MAASSNLVLFGLLYHLETFPFATMFNLLLYLTCHHRLYLFLELWRLHLSLIGRMVTALSLPETRMLLVCRVKRELQLRFKDLYQPSALYPRLLLGINKSPHPLRLPLLVCLLLTLGLSGLRLVSQLDNVHHSSLILDVYVLCFVFLHA